MQKIQSIKSRALEWMKIQLEESGNKVEPYFSRSGAIQGSDQLLSEEALSESLNKLWLDLAESNCNDAIGIQVDPKGIYASGLLSHLALSAPTVDASIEAFSEYFHYVFPSIGLNCTRTDTEFSIEVVLVASKTPTALPRYDFIIRSLLHHFSIFTGQRFEDVIYCRPGPRPDRDELWSDAIEGVVLFEQQKCRLIIKNSDLEKELTTAESSIFDLSKRALQQNLLDRNRSFSEKVRTQILQKVSVGSPKRKEIATTLGLSEKTLCNMLGKEGTSFTNLLSEVRGELAEFYLRQRNLSIKEISYKLGFDNQSNFNKACKRWFGCNPKSARERVISQI